MASGDINLRLLDLPEVQHLLELLRELALSHCQGCEDEVDHRKVEMAEVGLKQGFIDGVSGV